MEDLNTEFQELQIREDQEMDLDIHAEPGAAICSSDPVDTRPKKYIYSMSDEDINSMSNEELVAAALVGKGLFWDTFEQAWKSFPKELQEEIKAIANALLPTYPATTGEGDKSFEAAKSSLLEEIVVGLTLTPDDKPSTDQVEHTLMSQFCKEFDCVVVTADDVEDAMQGIDDGAPGA